MLIGDSATPARICRSCFLEHQKFSSPSHQSSGSVDKNHSTDSNGGRHGAAGGGDFHSRYEKIKKCYTSNKYHYGPSPSQYFILHIPCEGVSASAAALQNSNNNNHHHPPPSSHSSSSLASSTQLPNSVPIVVLIHGGFWKIKYGIDNSTIDSLVPFLLSKGMAVCQVEYRRVGSRRKEQRHDVGPQQDSHSHLHGHPGVPGASSPYALSVSPTFLQQYPPSQLMYMHVAHQLPTPDENWERMRQEPQSQSQSQSPAADDEGGFPHTNEDVLQALRLLHHKCQQMNSSSASGVDSFTHHYIAANGSRCISRLAKLDTSRTVLFGHSAGGYLALWASCRLKVRHPPPNLSFFSPDKALDNLYLRWTVLTLSSPLCVVRRSENCHFNLCCVLLWLLYATSLRPIDMGM